MPSPALHRPGRSGRALPAVFAGALACALIHALAAAPRALAYGEHTQAYPLGAMDAWGYIMDGDSMRIQDVRSGGPLDDSGIRNRDEVTGVQVGRQFVPFKGAPKNYMRVLGEGIDAGMAKGGATLSFQMRLGRDTGMAPVPLPKLGQFVAGHVIDKVVPEAKENKNEFFLRNCAAWIAKKDKAGQIGGAALNPGMAWAGLALMAGPDASQEKMVGRFADAVQKEWAAEGKRPNKGHGQDSYGQILNSDIWGVLFLSEWNWRHPDYDRAAVLAKACDEMAQNVLNPTYVYKEPSWHKHDPGTKDPANPKKEYRKDDFTYAKGRINARNLAAAWWCWRHCADTSNVKVNPKALEAARQHLLDLTMPADAKGARAFAKGKDGAPSFAMDRETAACFVHALWKSPNPTEARIAEALAAHVNRSPFALMGDQSEFGVMATSTLWLKTGGVPRFKERFNEWRWHLALMMQSEGTAHFCMIVPDPPYWEPNPLGNKLLDANAMGAFLMAAPARKLKMLGAEKPARVEIYELGKAPGSPSSAPPSTPPGK